MAIETEVRGDPSSVDAAATWLDSSLAPAVEAGVAGFATSRNDAQGDWEGEAGEAFVGAMGRARGKGSDLHDDIVSGAAALTAFAAVLRRVQREMERIRGEAGSGGLSVSGQSIADPGAGPSRPSDSVPAGATQGEVDAHDALVDAYDLHQDKIRLFNRLASEAQEAWDDLTSGARQLEDKYRGVTGANWAFNAGTIMAGFGGAAMEFNASALRGTATTLGDEAAANLARLRANPGAAGLSRLYDDLDRYRGLSQSADDLARSADDLAGRGGSMPIKIGGALAAAGVVYDIANGKDPVQATVAGAGGFAASVGAGMATGALIGSFVPVPGVGTAVGAVIGAGVGIFTSGAIDSLFENGPDVGAAVGAGADAVGDTVEAIGDGVGAIADGIGGLFG